MPELPEVETVMRGLQAAAGGPRHRARRRASARSALAAAARAWQKRLTGARVIGFRRRGKYILMRLDGGDSVLLHLGMSGRMVLDARCGRNAADAARASGAGDRRRLARWASSIRAGSARSTWCRRRRRTRTGCWPDLGPEPLDAAFSPARLSAALAGKRTPIKAALLDQKVVAGLGNIYVCEALFRARLSPLRLGAHRAGRARRAAGAGDQGRRCARRSPPAAPSLRDYVQPDGELGYFQHAWKVYGREGEPCERCPGPPACPGIRRIMQSARSTFYCPRTQR